MDASQYRAFAEFRRALQGYLRASERLVRAEGLTPQQYNLLVTIGARPEGAVSVGELAEALLISHNTAVELSQRAEAAGLVERRPDPAQGRRTLLSLTGTGQDKLERITSAHLRSLAGSRGELITALARWDRQLNAFGGEGGG